MKESSFNPFPADQSTSATLKALQLTIYSVTVSVSFYGNEKQHCVSLIYSSLNSLWLQTDMVVVSGSLGTVRKMLQLLLLNTHSIKKRNRNPF